MSATSRRELSRSPPDLTCISLDPSDFLVPPAISAQVIDFGFSKILETSDERTYTFCGTPDYLAPEIIYNTGHGKPVDW